MAAVETPATDVEPTGRTWPGWLPRAGRIAGGVLVALVAFEAALVEAFLVPLHIRTVVFPLSVPLAVVGNILFARLMAKVTGRAVLAIVPGVLWLIVVLALAAPRPEGDLIVPGTWVGLAFLFCGAIAAAFGAMSQIMAAQVAPK